MTEREALENDLAALDALGRLAGWAAESETGRHGEGELQAVRRVLDDGAGGVEASALVAWVRARIVETENSLSALEGGMPEPLVDAVGALVLECEVLAEAARRVADLVCRGRGGAR
jgi:hypothetical protein